MEKNSLIMDKHEVVVIGGSAGSLEVILQVLPLLQRDLGIPVIIVIHRNNTYESTLPALLGSKTRLNVKEAEEKERILAGHIYIAPADYHLLIEEDLTFSLDHSEKVNFSRPSIDVTLESASKAFGSGVVGILLSGANADGVEGLKTVKKNNGIASIQDPATAEVAFMPQQALLHVAIDQVLTVNGIAEFINSL